MFTDSLWSAAAQAGVADTSVFGASFQLPFQVSPSRQFPAAAASSSSAAAAAMYATNASYLGTPPPSTSAASGQGHSLHRMPLSAPPAVNAAGRSSQYTSTAPLSADHTSVSHLPPDLERRLQEIRVRAAAVTSAPSSAGAAAGVNDDLQAYLPTSAAAVPTGFVDNAAFLQQHQYQQQQQQQPPPPPALYHVAWPSAETMPGDAAVNDNHFSMHVCVWLGLPPAPTFALKGSFFLWHFARFFF